MAGGRPKGKYSQGYRLVKTMEMIQSRRYVTVRMLMDAFEISRRTAHRDLGILQESYSVAESGHLPTGEKFWQLSGHEGRETLKLTVMEMTALYMGKNFFNFTQGTDLKTSIDSLFAKVSHRLASSRSSHQSRLALKFYCTPGAPKSYAAFDDQLNEIVTGLLEEQLVSIVYQKPGAEPREDVIRPWSLVVHNNALYLIAYSQRQQSERTYAVERILRAQWLRGQGFAYPEGYRPEEYLSRAFGITVGDTRRVVLRVSSAIAEYFKARKWHASQEILPSEGEGQDGDAFIALDVPITPELFSWILSFGDSIEVIRPESLRRRLMEIGRRLHRIYVQKDDGPRSVSGRSRKKNPPDKTGGLEP